MEDLKNEFQIEKEDMLETIRELTRQLKLVQVLIQNLIPFEHANNIEKRAKWDPETDEWKLEKLDSHPTSLKPKRPIGRYGARRSETEFARRNKMLDPTNVRWKVENVIQLELDMPERRTRDFENHMNYMLDRVGLNEDEPPIVYENDITQQQSFAKQTDPIGSSSGYGTGTGTDVDADAKHEKESTKKSSSKTSSSDSSFDSSNGAKSTKVKTKTSDELEEDLIDEDPTVVKKSSKRPASAR
jgi:kinesin family protein 3/17